MRDSSLSQRCAQFVQRIPLLRLRLTTAAEWRQRAKVALILSGEEAQQRSISALIRLSRDTDAGVRLTAIEALSQFIFTDPSSVQPLEVAQLDSDHSA